MYFTKNLLLGEGEKIIKVVHQHPLTFITSFLVVFVLVMGPFFFLFPLFYLGVIGIIIFFLYLGIGIILGIRLFVIWYFNVFIITNKRVVDITQHGFFDRVVSEIPLEKVRDVSYRVKGLRQTLFGYGNVQVVGESIKLELCNISGPQKIQGLIAGSNRSKEN